MNYLRHLFKWRKTLPQALSSFALKSLFLNVCLFCRHFCLLSQFEIIRCFLGSLMVTLTSFFDEIQLKKENCFLGARVLGPKSVDQSPMRSGYVTGFVDKLSSRFFHPAKHYVIARRQKQVFKKNVASLKIDEVVLVLDFAENYSFLSQGCTQSYILRQQSIPSYYII